MNDKMNDDDEKDMKLLSMNWIHEHIYTIYINTILYIQHFPTKIQNI